MDVSTHTQVSIRESLEHLATIIKQQPAFLAFMQAHQALQADEEAQRLIAEGRHLNGLLQFDWSKERQEQLNTLLQQLDQLSCVQAYHQAEHDLRKLFCSVDAIVSDAAGVDFAVNARRRSCCGG